MREAWLMSWLIRFGIAHRYCYASIKTETQMLVDTPRNLEKIRININVTVPRIPCYVIALDTEDVLVSDTPHAHHRTRTRTRALCSPGGGTVVAVKGGGVEDFQEKSIVKLHMESPDSELSGCSIAGYINVPKVPGNFHPRPQRPGAGHRHAAQHQLLLLHRLAPR